MTGERVLVTDCCLCSPSVQITRNGNDLWLSYWVSKLDEHQHHPPHHYHGPPSRPHSTPAPPLAISHLWSTHKLLPATRQTPCFSHTVCPISLVSEQPYTVSPILVRCHPGLRLAFGHANTSGLHGAASAASDAASQLSQALPVSRQLLGAMARHQPALDPDTKFYLGVLLCIAAANSFFTFVRAFSFAYGGLVAARKLHNQLLTAVMNAPARFFQVTLPGENPPFASHPASPLLQPCALADGFPKIQCRGALP